MFKLSRRSKSNRLGVDPRLIEISDLAIEITTVDFGHPKYSGLRTAEQQNEMYKDKVSKLDGYKKISKHQQGTALDFYAFVDGKASWDTEHLAIVACAFLQAASILGYKLRWGGFFRPVKKHKGTNYKGGWDYPHVELID